ncbi:MAG: ROK family protein [Bacteriovoracaceae bacterium]
MFVLGLDIGGTKIECVLVDLGTNKNFNPDQIKKIKVKMRIDSNRLTGYANVLENIAKLCLKVCKEAKTDLSACAGIGVGLPGTVDPKTNRMVNGNTQIFIQKDFAGDLKKALKFKGKVVLENDANCFSYAESVCGVGKKHAVKFSISVEKQVSIGVILGTGVGGGIVINQTILRGRNGSGGEIGHTNLITNGLPCYCGHNGCVEQYLSGTALEGHFNGRIYSQIGKIKNCKEIFELYDQLDPLAIATVKQYRKYLAQFLINLTNIFDPDYFVFGGGLSNQKIIYEGIEEDLEIQTFAPKSKPKIYQNSLGDSAGVFGAMLLALK